MKTSDLLEALKDGKAIYHCSSLMGKITTEKRGEEWVLLNKDGLVLSGKQKWGIFYQIFSNPNLWSIEDNYDKYVKYKNSEYIRINGKFFISPMGQKWEPCEKPDISCEEWKDINYDIKASLWKQFVESNVIWPVK